MKILNATYPSPNFRYDPAAREVIFERLNPDTGDVTFQVPSRETLREEKHAAAIGADPNAVAPSPALPSPPAVEQLGPVAVQAGPAPPTKSACGAGIPSISILV